jgi:hypothetical protein
MKRFHATTLSYRFWWRKWEFEPTYWVRAKDRTKGRPSYRFGVSFLFTHKLKGPLKRPLFPMIIVVENILLKVWNPELADVDQPPAPETILPLPLGSAMLYPQNPMLLS